MSKSVERRIATLMAQFDTLSERLSTTGLRVILTQTVDVTFLPGFKTMGGQDKDTVSWKGGMGNSVRWLGSGVVVLSIFLIQMLFIMDRIRD